MPGNRVRVAADWLLDAVLPRQAVQLGLVRSWSVPLDTASPELARVAGRPWAAAETRSGSGAATTRDTDLNTDTESAAFEATNNQPGGGAAEAAGPVKRPDTPAEGDS